MYFNILGCKYLFKLSYMYFNILGCKYLFTVIKKKYQEKDDIQKLK